MAKRLLHVLPLLLFACSTQPAPTGLRYAATDTRGWTQEQGGALAATLAGARCTVELGADGPRLQVRVENRTGKPLEVRVGPEATRDPAAAIGEVRVLPLDRKPGEDMADFAPYLSQQPAAVDDGAQAVFYLDAPLGRDPSIGQYLVLVVEARGAGSAAERRLLPLVVTNAAPAAPR